MSDYAQRQPTQQLENSKGAAHNGTQYGNYPADSYQAAIINRNSGKTADPHAPTGVHPMAKLRPWQAKLVVGSAHDPAEAEADQAAHEVVHGKGQAGIGSAPPATPVAARISRMAAAPEGDTQEEEVQAKCKDCDKESLQRQWDPQAIHRSMPALAGGKAATRQPVQLKEWPRPGHQGPDKWPQPDFRNKFIASDDTAQQLQAQKGSGQALATPIKGQMEHGFGADFSKVKIHRSQDSFALNDTLNAKAFTSGDHIFFGQGQYDDQSQEGKQLIAHELTHTIQQGAVAPAIQRKVDRKEESNANTSTIPWCATIETEGNSSIGFQKQPKKPETNDDRIWPAFVQGDKVWVLGISKDNWQHVEREYQGKRQVGYVDWRNLKACSTLESNDDYFHARILKELGVGKYWYSTRAEFQQKVRDDKAVLQQFKADVGIYRIYQELKGTESGDADAKAVAKRLKEENKLQKFEGSFDDVKRLVVVSLNKVQGELASMKLEVLKMKGELAALSEPRKYAQQQLEASKKALEEIKVQLKAPSLPTGQKTQLESKAVALIKQISKMQDMLTTGGAQTKGMAAIGGTLAAGMLIPVPEEIVTWPLAAIGVVILLLFTAKAASDGDIYEAAKDLALLVAEAIVAINFLSRAECIDIFVKQCRQGPCSTCLQYCITQGKWDDLNCPIK